MTMSFLFRPASFSARPPPSLSSMPCRVSAADPSQPPPSSSHLAVTPASCSSSNSSSPASPHVLYPTVQMVQNVDGGWGITTSMSTNSTSDAIYGSSNGSLHNGFGGGSGGGQQLQQHQPPSSPLPTGTQLLMTLHSLHWQP
jgi:hypothetical protein